MAVHTIYITRACSMNCAYCYERNKTDAHLSVASIKRILQNIYRADAMPDEVEIFGGEPLLNWRGFLLILRFCAERKTPLSTSTNGLLLSYDKIKVLKRHNILVGISYDGESTHDIYRRTKDNRGTEPIVRDSIRRSLANGLNIVVNMTFQKANSKCLFADIQKLHDLGINKIKIHTVNNQRYSVSKEQELAVFTRVLSFAKDTGMEVYLDLSLSRSKLDHYHYHTDNSPKVQPKGVLGQWDLVGWG